MRSILLAFCSPKPQHDTHTPYRVLETVQRVLLLVGLLGAWELPSTGLRFLPFLLPPPSAVAISLFNGLKYGLLIRHFGVTFFETVAGFLLGSVTGLLGRRLASSRNRARSSDCSIRA